MVNLQLKTWFPYYPRTSLTKIFQKIRRRIFQHLANITLVQILGKVGKALSKLVGNFCFMFSVFFFAFLMTICHTCGFVNVLCISIAIDQHFQKIQYYNFIYKLFKTLIVGYFINVCAYISPLSQRCCLMILIAAQIF